MKIIAINEIIEALRYRDNLEKIDFTSLKFKDLDLSNMNLSNIDFSKSNFIDVNLSNSDLSNSNFRNAYFKNGNLSNANLQNTNLKSADLRNGNIEGADIRGANFHFSCLENCKKDNIIKDLTTKYFDMVCPEKGYFRGYKKCFNNKMVELLILEDSLRGSATNDACRTNMAKVLSITSIDEKESFNEARSFVDENFIYKLGETVYVKDFNEDRWVDSTTGIHFYMTRELAIGYM